MEPGHQWLFSKDVTHYHTTRHYLCQPRDLKVVVRRSMWGKRDKCTLLGPQEEDIKYGCVYE